MTTNLFYLIIPIEYTYITREKKRSHSDKYNYTKFQACIKINNRLSVLLVSFQSCSRSWPRGESNILFRREREKRKHISRKCFIVVHGDAIYFFIEEILVMKVLQLLARRQQSRRPPINR